MIVTVTIFPILKPLSIIRKSVELSNVNNHDEFTLSLSGRLNELQAVYQLKAPFKKKQ